MAIGIGTIFAFLYKQAFIHPFIISNQVIVVTGQHDKQHNTITKIPINVIPILGIKYSPQNQHII